MFLLSSMSKGRKLVKYQKRILSSGKENSLKEYIEFCLKDPGIAKIAALYELTEKDFIAMYYQFSIVGLNQYISGHYAALSTLAYGEPLLYAIIKNRDGMNKRELGHKLYQYWSNELPPGTLISEVKSSNQFKTA